MKVCDPCSSSHYLPIEDDGRRINYQSRFRYYQGVVQGNKSDYSTPEQKAEEKYLDEIFKRHLRRL